MKWLKEKFNKIFFAIEEEEFEINTQNYEEELIHNERQQENKKKFVFPVINDVQKFSARTIDETLHEENKEQKLELPIHLRQEGGISKVYEVEVSGIRELLERRRNGQTYKNLRKVEQSNVKRFPNKKEEPVSFTNSSPEYLVKEEVKNEKLKKFVPTKVPSPVYGFMNESMKQPKKSSTIEELLEEKLLTNSQKESSSTITEEVQLVRSEADFSNRWKEPVAISENQENEIKADDFSNELGMQNTEKIIIDTTLASEVLPEVIKVDEETTSEANVLEDVQALQVDQISFTNSTIHIENLNVKESPMSNQDLTEEPSQQIEDNSNPIEDNSNEMVEPVTEEQKTAGSRLPFNVLMLKSDKEKLASKQLKSQLAESAHYKEITSQSSFAPSNATSPTESEPNQVSQQSESDEEWEQNVDLNETSKEVLINSIEEEIVIEAIETMTEMEHASKDIMHNVEAAPQQNYALNTTVNLEMQPLDLPEHQDEIKEKVDVRQEVEKSSIHLNEEIISPIEMEEAFESTIISVEEIQTDESAKKFNEEVEAITETVEEKEQQVPTNLNKDAQQPLENTMLNEPKPYNKPPTSILAPPEEMLEDTEWMEEQGEHLVEALSHFQVQAQVESIVQGPAVTQFEITVGHGTKVSKVRNLSDDIQLALAARDIRIDAPIPGKRSIGIEIPNRMSRAVRLSEVTDSEKFTKSDSPLEAALGLDLNGKPVTLDLRKMPHGLIAGATGSGKSVCINSILVSLLYKSAPHELKLMLIDPKMVELAPFNHIPHLVSPVITDVKAATEALKWAVEEMERRYQLFMHSGTRDITRYNKLCEENKMYAQKLPYLLIVIDELADLMMMSPADVELAISRLAQKARACGIHLILATQRPSVDVITGTLKSNIPTRIAFAVSSQIDSRTILDSQGAERLLGRGDMLYLGNGMNAPQRIQGTFVTDEEIEEVVEYVRSQGEPNYFFKSEELVQRSEVVEEQDELFEEVCRYVYSQGSASTSALQRRYHIGYNRAARLIDLLESHGYISEQKGSKPRDVYITEAILENTFS